MTALTAYFSNTASAVVATAQQLLSSPPASAVTVSGSGQVTKNATGWVELWSQGRTSTVAPVASEPAPSDQGFLLDPTTLQAQQILAGNWTPTVRVKSVGVGFTITLVARAFVRSSGGVYTQIGSDITLATAYATTTTLTAKTASGSLPATIFGTGDKLYIDVLVNITTGSSNNTASNRVIQFEVNSGANSAVVTPGYLPAPVTGTAAGTSASSGSASGSATGSAASVSASSGVATGSATSGGGAPAGHVADLFTAPVADATNNPTIAATTTVAVAAGDTAIFYLSARGGTAGMTVSPTITNAPGDATVEVLHHDRSGSPAAAIVRMYCPSGMASGTVLTFTWSASASRKVVYGESVTGLANANAITAGNDAANSTPDAGTTGATTTTSGWHAAAWCWNSTASTNSGASPTDPEGTLVERVDQIVGASTFAYLYGASGPVAAAHAGGETATVTVTNTIASWAGVQGVWDGSVAAVIGSGAGASSSSGAATGSAANHQVTGSAASVSASAGAAVGVQTTHPVVGYSNQVLGGVDVLAVEDLIGGRFTGLRQNQAVTVTGWGTAVTEYERGRRLTYRAIQLATGTWADVAAGSFDSAFTAIADALVATGDWSPNNPAYWCFHHEATLGSNTVFGTGQDYINAWRRFRDVLDAGGYTLRDKTGTYLGGPIIPVLVHFHRAFTKTLWDASSEAPPAGFAHADFDPDAGTSPAPPGTSYYDGLGFDVYNSIQTAGTLKYGTAAANMLDDMVAKAADRGKFTFIGECGCEDGATTGDHTNKADWFDSVRAYLAGLSTSQQALRALLLTIKASAENYNVDSSSQSIAAFQRLASDSLFQVIRTFGHSSSTSSGSGIGAGGASGVAASVSASAGSAAGSATRHQVTGSASGVSVSSGTASATISVTGSASSTSVSAGAATGSASRHQFVGSAASTTTSAGSAIGSTVGAGTAVSVSHSAGLASGVLTFKGAATSTSASAGTASGAATRHQFTGSAASTSTSTGTARGALVGHATSTSTSSGAASGSATHHQFLGAAASASASAGTAAGSISPHMFIGAAAGASTSAGAASGSATRHQFSGSASSVSASSGAAIGATAGQGTAVSTSSSTGTAAGRITFKGLAGSISSSAGSATATASNHEFIGSGAGNSNSTGSAVGHPSTIGGAVSDSTSSGVAIGRVRVVGSAMSRSVSIGAAYTTPAAVPVFMPRTRAVAVASGRTAATNGGVGRTHVGLEGTLTHV